MPTAESMEKAIEVFLPHVPETGTIDLADVAFLAKVDLAVPEMRMIGKKIFASVQFGSPILVVRDKTTNMRTHLYLRK